MLPPRFLSVLLLIAWLLLRPVPLQADETLFRVKEKGKWGFINKAGKMVIPPTYDGSSYQFSEGLAAVQVGDRWGYISPSGKFVIPPQFDGAERFEGGFAAVYKGQPFVGGGKWGYIDRTGKLVLPPDDRLSYGRFDDGRMQVRVNDKWGYVDRNGALVIPAKYEYAFRFSEGLAAVRDEKGDAYIDPQGTVVLQLVGIRHMYNGFKQGRAVAVDERTSNVGFIDKKGQWAIRPRFDSAESFSEGRAAVRIAEEDATGWPVRKWGFIDERGTIVIPPKYSNAAEFSDGLARVQCDGKWGFIDRDGKQVIPCQFDFAESFWKGLAQVHVGGYDDKSWDGYIDTKGQFVWKPSDADAKDAARKAEVPSIRLFCDPKEKGAGLLVTCRQPVQPAGPDAGRVEIVVQNRMEEDIFLDVTDLGSLGYSLEWKNGDYAMSSGDAGAMMGAEHLLKQLGAAHLRDGKWFNASSTTLKGSLPSDALSSGRARGTVSIWVAGFYRNNGKRFFQNIDVPIEVAERDPPKKPQTRQSD